MADELVAFLQACLDEEQAAREALARTTTSRRMIGGQMVTVTNRPPAWRTALWPPERVLREVEAKRRLLDLHKVGDYGECVTCDVGAYSCGCCGWGDFPCDTVRLLALPYADHPVYRPERRPDTSPEPPEERRG